jgi:hypothetical protein
MPNMDPTTIAMQFTMVASMAGSYPPGRPGVNEDSAEGEGYRKPDEGKSGERDE